VRVLKVTLVQVKSLGVTLLYFLKKVFVPIEYSSKEEYDAESEVDSLDNNSDSN
jgi:hypothetical protein